jgi:hypothetical protein
MLVLGMLGELVPSCKGNEREVPLKQMVNGKVWGRGWKGFGDVWIRRKGALEHRTLDPVILHQGVRQKEREVWTQKVWRPLLNM